MLLDRFYYALVHEEIQTNESKYTRIIEESRTEKQTQTILDHNDPHSQNIPEADSNSSTHTIIKNVPEEKPPQTIIEHLDFYNDKFDYMTDTDFKEYCVELLQKNGFNAVTVKSKGEDFGVDILANQNKTLYAIQCKHYSHDVGINAVYQITGGMKYYGANVGVVLTNRYFTENAKTMAAATGIVLWDRDFLLSLINPTIDNIPTCITDMQYTTRKYDVYFDIAAKLIITRQKVSIGMIQRELKIGAPRAERLMDQLSDAGVIAPYNSAQPTEILMNLEEFEEYLEKHDLPNL